MPLLPQYLLRIRFLALQKGQMITFMGFFSLLLISFIESIRVKIKNWTKNYSFIVITVQIVLYNLIMNK